jgi:hypothetical protein
MAGDWIKMRIDLSDDPTVAGISARLSLDEYGVIGRLHKLWSWADRHTTDGVTAGVDMRWIDRFVAKKGFAESMVQFGWLNYDSESGVLSFPGFDIHNGDSAKSRCDAALRQRKCRQRFQGETNGGTARAPIPRPFIRHVFKRDDYTCVYCGENSTPEREASGKALLSVDHIQPHSRGNGRQAIEDLATCCRLCNNEKTDRTPEEWGVLPRFLNGELEYMGGRIVTKNRDETVTTLLQKALPEERREEGIENRKYAHTPEEVIRHGQTLYPPADEEFCRYWFDQMEGSGWVDKNRIPINNWKAAFAANWRGAQHRQHERAHFARKPHGQRTEADRERDRTGYGPDSKPLPKL